MLDQIEAMAREIGAIHGVQVQEFNGEADHIHFLLRSKPNTTMSAFINSLKSATSRVLKRLYPEIRKKLWKEQFWSNSYCLITVGGAPLEVVKTNSPWWNPLAVPAPAYYTAFDWTRIKAEESVEKFGMTYFKTESK